LILAATVRESLPGQRDEPTGSGFITGQVVDGQSSRPVPGAIVTLFEVAGVHVSEAIADGQGRFVFSGLPEGGFRILAERGGWRAETTDEVNLRSGERARVTISLLKHALISGRLTDENGEAVVHAQVWPRQWVVLKGHRHLLGNAAAVRTDDHGRFTASLEPGNWIVGTDGARVMTATDADGRQRRISYGETFFPQSRTAEGAVVLALQAGEERHGVDIQLRAEPVVRVSGVLVRSSERASMPSIVELHTKANGRIERSSRVDAQGRFTFEDVSPGSYVVQTQMVNAQDPSTGGALWARAAVDVADRDLHLSVALHAPLLVSGRVVFDGSSPQSREAMGGSVGLWLYREDELPRSHDYSPFVPIGTDGRFSLMTVPGRYVIAAAFIPSGAVTLPRQPGRWRIRSATYAGTDVADTPLDISRDTGDIVVTLTDRRTTLRGLVTTREGTVGGSALIVFPADEALWTALPAGRRFHTTSIPRDGAFEITALPEGDYLIAAVRTNGYEAYDGTHSSLFLRAIAPDATRIRLLEGQTRTVDLSAISATRIDPALAPARKPLDLLETADVRVLAVSTSREVGDGKLVRSEREARGAIVRGTIVDEHGLPLPEAVVHIRAYRTGPNGRALAPPADPDSFPEAVRADARGEYRAYGLAPGEYVIHAMPPETADSVLLMTIGADLDAVSRSTSAGRTALPQRVTAMYAPLFYPDAIEPSQAEVVKLAPGDERVIDFHFRLVQTVTLQGEVRSPQGAVAASLGLFPGGVEMPESMSSRNASTDASGAFVIRGVTPGQYRLIATASVAPGVRLAAVADLSVHGDQGRIVLNLQPPGTVLLRLRGNAVEEARQQARVMSLVAVGSVMTSRYSAPIVADGSFQFSDVTPGRYRFELPMSLTRGGLRVASQLVDGVETIATGFELRSGAYVEVVVELAR
jgi:protocatechuate 3,4-dioxygenase beta subunit